jgi:hypothetical protein
MIEFISHEEFPEDNYTKELVYLQINKEFRCAYVRKQMQNGTKFWAPISLGIQKHGKKEYFPAFLFDSNFLEKDIKNFLEARSWEKSAQNYVPPAQNYVPPAQKFNTYSPPQQEQEFQGELPF